MQNFVLNPNPASDFDDRLLIMLFGEFFIFFGEIKILCQNVQKKQKKEPIIKIWWHFQFCLEILSRKKVYVKTGIQSAFSGSEKGGIRHPYSSE